MRLIVCGFALTAAFLLALGCTPNSPSAEDPPGAPTTLEESVGSTLPSAIEPQADGNPMADETPKSGDVTEDEAAADKTTDTAPINDPANEKSRDEKSRDEKSRDEKSRDEKSKDEKSTEEKPGKGEPVEPAEKPAETTDAEKAPADKKTTQADSRRQGKLFRGGKEGDVIEISFEDVNLGMPVGAAFRPFMLTDRAKSLNGKRVRIKGFVMASDRIKGMKEFVLLRNTECKFGPGGQADHLLRVFMRKNETASYRSKPVSIEGILRLNVYPNPRQTWSVFDLEDASGIVNLTR